MKFIYLFALVFLLLFLSIVACNIDHGIEPGPWIEGKILIQSIDKVEEAKAGDLIVVVAPDFPPGNWTDIIKTPPIYFDRNVEKDTVDYIVPLNSGTYDVVAVLWKPKGEEWSFETISNILGVYTEPNLFKPKSVTINKADKFVPNIDIYADFGFIRSGAFIKGKISYVGEFNPDSEMMILASFPSRPSKVSDYLFALGWDLTLPIARTPDNDPYDPYYEFKLDVSPGNHKYVALFWKGKKGSPYDFKKIADLEIPNIDPPIQIGTLKYEGKRINKGQTFEYWIDKANGDTTWINLVADFNKTYP
jgi:hypothetical protein